MNEYPKQKTVLMTGSTGAFGKFLALELLKDQTVNLILLVRGLSLDEARNRVSEIINAGGQRVLVFKSDLAKEDLGLARQEYDELSNKTTHLLHSAASTRFNLPLNEARLHNVETTRRIIRFAKTCPNLVRFGFLSTALVAGKRTGVIKEDEFEHSEGFNNTYQQTKYEAEALVRTEMKILPVVIFRPPLIVAPGFQKDLSSLDNFFSLLIYFVAKGLLPVVPGDEKGMVDLVHASDAASIIARLLLKERLSHRVYHITNGNLAFTVRKMVHMIEQKKDKKLLLEFFGRDTDGFMKRVDELSQYNPKVAEAYKRVMTFLFEPAHSKVFDNTNTLDELNIKKIGKNPADVLDLILDEISWDFSE